jgi:magnesium-transporting ATPase (P-type)
MPLVLNQTLESIKATIDNLNIEKQQYNDKIFRIILWIVVIALIICIFIFVMYVKNWSIQRMKLANTSVGKTEELNNLVNSIQQEKLKSSHILHNYINNKIL